MFTELPPEKTGVITENSYSDPRMWGDRYQEFTLGAIGTGIAVGDYDGDGRPDIFVVSKTGKCRLFRNLGNWKFEDVTVKAGITVQPTTDDKKGVSWLKEKLGGGSRAAADDTSAWKQGATFVDVNNDGKLDIYVCRFGAPNLLYINQGDGTFKEEAAARGLAVVDACGQAAFCDYDRDGWLDVYIQTNMLDASNHSSGQRDYLFHNNGNGTFTDVSDRAGITGVTLAHSATWWDYDEDGWPDIYVANDFAGPDQLYHNNRDGTFTDVINEVVPHMPYSSMGADLGDVNNDGRIDLFVADMATTTHEKDQRDMASSRALNKNEAEKPGTAPQYSHNALYLSTGTGKVLEAAQLAGLAATDWTWSVRWEDLDNDGRLDLHITNGMNREYQNSDLRDRIIVAENPEERLRIMRESPPLNETHLAFRNLGNLRFENVSKTWGLDQKGVSFGAAFADFDGDGDLDLVFSNYEKGITLLRNDCQTGHRVIVALRGTQSNRFGVGAVVRIETNSGVQVRQLVLARGYLSSSEPIVHFGTGDDDRLIKLSVEWPSGQTQIFRDLAVDRKFVITEPEGKNSPSSPTPRAPAQFENVSTVVGFQPIARESPSSADTSPGLQPFRLGRRGPALAVADLNGDGIDDVVLGGTAEDPARLFLGTSAGTFAARPVFENPLQNRLDDGPLLVFDADGDGSLDLLVTHDGALLAAGSPAYQPSLWLNDGHGNFHAAPLDSLPNLPISTGAVAAADFDHDGRLDVFIGGRSRPGLYPLPPRSALLANRGGKFEDVTTTLAPGLSDVGLVTAAIWTDVDGDGWADLLVATEWGPVKYFHNNAGQSFSDWTEKAGFASAGTGWWTSLASADFNGDGRPDYVVGNVGLNTQYHATINEPALIFYGNFGGGNGSQLIEAYYEENRLFPWRTRHDLGAKMPNLLKKFPLNDDYAKATLEEIFGADRLARAKRFAATNLNSGVFLSQPDGTYRFEPLPRIAQIAPFQGLIAGDFDGDGLADIYAVQNSFAPSHVVGHFDGGLSQLLRGDGRGHFSPVPLLESGLIVPGDAKALAVLDLDHDGWPDFLVTRNNDAALAFRNHGETGRHSFQVKLHGPSGNPLGVGARITVEMMDGSIQTAEVFAGSGYYSQSSSCFFGYKDQPPHKITVRWPSGKMTEYPFTPGPQPLVLEAR
jgi:hypothetical protein